MNNWKISVRLMVLVGVLSVVLVGIGSFGLVSLSRSNEALKSVYEDRMVPLGQLEEMGQKATRNRVLVMDMIIRSHPDNVEKRDAELKANIEDINKLWAQYTATTLTPEEKALADEFVAARKAYVQQGLLPARDAVRAGQPDEADRIYQEKVSALATPFRAAQKKLVQLHIDVARQEYEQAVARFETVRTVSLVVIVLGVVLSVLLGLSMIRGIARALTQAVQAAQAVAQGDLSQQVRVYGRDEIAQLLTALAAMQQNLAQVVSRVRQGADSVATAATEVAQGNGDLSARTESQASALEQTAASMEELSSTVKQNADNAREANQLAQSASTVAVQGGEVVAQVVDTMKGINDSSKKIADIISVIDGIAFQTNILALNAAVEAARAGEQGRGFAVVAGEVRNLAGRSADAAKEIKALITDSVQRVEHGSALVDQAGSTMNEVVTSIRRVTDIMGEISAASTEQSQGVSQVGEAVTQMDQATQQNAALVEEMAAAASSLKSQANELVQTVATFKLAQGQNTHHSSVPYREVTAPAKPTHTAARLAVKPTTKPAQTALPSAPAAVKKASAEAGGDWESF